MAISIGKRFGQYHILALLGEGGMAHVYQAQHAGSKRDVALKVIKPEFAETETFRKRFEREAQTVAALKHPHILKIIEYGRQKNTLFLAMELLTGGSLDVLIRQGPLALEQTNRLLSQIVSALAYAHEAGVIHRDLKPQNVMLNAEGDAMLTDFGLAKLIADGVDRSVLTQTGAPIGTPAYMSPEQWMGEAADVRSDVYGLGLLTFEMLVGSSPFKAENAYDLLHKHLYMSPPSLQKLRSDVPVALDSVMRHALAKDRIERYPSVTEFYQDFRAALAGQPLSVAAQGGPSLIDTGQAAEQERQALAHLEAEGRVSHPSTRSVASRVVNPLPQDVSSRYVGRARQVADLANLLGEKTRLVSVYGRGGMGKTALVCKALADLQRAERSPDGIVNLSAVTTGISLDRVLTAFGKLLGGNDKILLDYLARDGQTPAAQKAGALLEKLQHGWHILFLDNLESLQDSTSGALTDPDTQALIELALGQGSGLRIVITSREPLVLPRTLKTWERQIPLDQGLPVDEAVALLRTLDPDGVAGLRDAPPVQLQTLAKKTGGFPRALEAAAGMLLEDPLLSLDSLLSEVSPLSSEIAPLIVQQAIARLSPDALQLMQALALFQHPVSQAALEFLLAPYLDTSKLREILARLVKGFFASFNKATQEFVLHPIDQEYCYANIPAGAPEDRQAAPARFTRHALHARAADFYAHQRKPQAEWRSLEDLAPQLAEFEHRMAAEDYDEAARLLLTIDRDYLWEWEQRSLLQGLHGRLRGHIRDAYLAHESLRRFAWTHFWDKLPEAITLFEQLRETAHRTGDRRAEADTLDDLAQTRRRVADVMGGFQLHEQALAIYREIEDRRGQGEALGGMGSCAIIFGPDRAIPYLEEAANIQRELDNRPSLAYVLGMLGASYLALGQAERALACDDEALDMARSRGGESLVRALRELGQHYAYLAQYDKALDYSRQAVVEADALAGGFLTMTKLISVGFFGIAQAEAGDLTSALESLRQINAEANSRQLPIASGGMESMNTTILATLLLEAGDVNEAYRLVEPALLFPIPPVYKVWHGLIAARAGNREAAVRIFEGILQMVQAMSPSLVSLYPRGLSLAALALLTGDDAKLQPAADSYHQALALGSLPGLQKHHLRLLDSLMRCPGGEKLAPVRAALAEGLA